MAERKVLSFRLERSGMPESRALSQEIPAQKIAGMTIRRVSVQALTIKKLALKAPETTIGRYQKHNFMAVIPEWFYRESIGNTGRMDARQKHPGMTQRGDQSFLAKIRCVDF